MVTMNSFLMVYLLQEEHSTAFLRLSFWAPSGTQKATKTLSVSKYIFSLLMQVQVFIPRLLMCKNKNTRKGLNAKIHTKISMSSFSFSCLHFVQVRMIRSSSVSVSFMTSVKLPLVTSICISESILLCTIKKKILDLAYAMVVVQSKAPLSTRGFSQYTNR